jgi:hypothetical protein
MRRVKIPCKDLGRQNNSRRCDFLLPEGGLKDEDSHTLLNGLRTCIGRWIQRLHQMTFEDFDINMRKGRLSNGA